MRIVTLNTWKGDGDYRRRLLHMAQGLRALQPDVVLLQEVLATPDGSADTAQHLARALGLQAVALPARAKHRMVDGVGRPSTSGLAVLLREPPVQAVAVPLPSDPADGDRVAQLLQLAPQGQPLWVGNLHLTHLPQAQPLRQRQLQTVWQALQRLAGDASAVPVVVGGDFNAPWPGPAAPTHWAGDVPLRASPCAAGKATARGADGTALDLDHVLLGPAWTDAQRAQARTHVALPPWAVAPQDAASDHAAVVLDVDWPRLA